MYYLYHITVVNYIAPVIHNFLLSFATAYLEFIRLDKFTVLSL